MYNIGYGVKMKNKKFFSALISVILVVAICVTTCTSAFAATSKELYISDLILCMAKSADEAETKFKAQGYKLMSEDNLNDSLSDGGMYLGYKSTPNRKEAITGISAMNMNGKYSYTDYENLLNSIKESVTATVNGLIPMITAYRTNYNDGKAIALSVHDTLNKFYEDDSKSYMGDFLLNCDLKDVTDLTKVFMQGYSPFIVNIQQLLFIAGESSNDKKWIEKMADSDEDFLLDLYMDSYPTPNKAYQAMAADYGNSADSIRLTWNSFYQNLSDIKTKYFTEENGKLTLNTDAITEQTKDAPTSADVTEGISEEALSEVLEKNIDVQSATNDFSDAVLIEYLNSVEYADGTMLDFFMRDESEVDDTELYSLAYFMGKKLCAQITNVSLQQVISRVIVDGENSKKDDFAEVSELLSSIDNVSIYEGVDRSLFDDGVALTSATTEKYVSSGKSWSEDLFDRIFQPGKAGDYKWYDFLAFYVMPVVVSAGIYVGLTAFISKFESIVGLGTKQSLSVIASTQGETVQISKLAINYIVEESSTYTEIMTKTTTSKLANLTYGKGSTIAASTGGKVILGVRAFFLAVAVVFTLISMGMAIYTLFAENEPQTAKYSSIPNHIVDTVSTDNGDDYIAYNYVPNLSGNAGDLNNYVGVAGWLTLYYTKDQSVGEPITTDMKIVKGSSNSPLDYDSVNLFGEESAINLTSKDYTGKKDSANGTYIYFNRGEALAVGSAFSSGNMAIAIGVGVVMGFAVDVFFQKLKNKNKGRKKQNA